MTNLFSLQVRRSLIHGLVCIGIVAILFRSAFIPILVSGNSMNPTLRSGQLKFGNRLAYRSSKPDRGDAVAVRIKETGELLLKRVVGLPGEHVSMYFGTVFIDRVPLDEPYVRLDGGLSMTPRALGHDEYWVVGDNRQVSAFGVVYLEEIVAQTIL